MSVFRVLWSRGGRNFVEVWQILHLVSVRSFFWQVKGLTSRQQARPKGKSTIRNQHVLAPKHVVERRGPVAENRVTLQLKSFQRPEGLSRKTNSVIRIDNDRCGLICFNDLPCCFDEHCNRKPSVLPKISLPNVDSESSHPDRGVVELGDSNPEGFP